jgi:hypothetical protein
MVNNSSTFSDVTNTSVTFSGQSSRLTFIGSSNSSTFSGATNTSVTFGGQSSRLTFIGSSNCGVIANGQSQTVSLINDSRMVVQNRSSTALKVLITGADSNITINDIMHNINIVLDHQGAYSITDKTVGSIGGAFINTEHSSIFVMGIAAKDLAHSVTTVG